MFILYCYFIDCFTTHIVQVSYFLGTKSTGTTLELSLEYTILTLTSPLTFEAPSFSHDYFYKLIY